MAPKIKINLKDKYDDGELDLSMCDLQDVPVKEIATFKKAYSLDLSSNHIVTLPSNFVILSNIIKLDLSKNQIRELPENFGELAKLKHLELDGNQLQHLPLSFSKLKNLKWLDLKDNQLVPKIAEVAGQCLDSKQCQECARNIVNFYAKLELQIQQEREVREQHRLKNLTLHEVSKKQKQQEKKKKSPKNKEKLQDKAENVNGTFSSEPTESISAALTDKKQAIDNLNSTGLNIRKLFLKLFVIFMALILMLFVLTSSQIVYTQDIENYVKLWWQTLLDKLPLHLRDVAKELEKHISAFHLYIGKKIANLIALKSDYQI